VLLNFVTSQSDCLKHIHAVYATLEERPFQGRVTHEMKMGFSSGGWRRVTATASTRAKAHTKSHLTRR
jgi:hypothetical protein